MENIHRGKETLTDIPTQRCWQCMGIKVVVNSGVYHYWCAFIVWRIYNNARVEDEKC